MDGVIGGVLGAFGLAASAGLNAYIPLLIVALTAKFTNLITLAQPYDALTSWWTIGVLALLSAIEFFADKVPAVDLVNDAIQTFVRPTAGAILFAASAKAITDVNPVLSLIMGLLVAGTVHGVKSVAVRPVVAASTAGAGTRFEQADTRFAAPGNHPGAAGTEEPGWSRQAGCWEPL